MPLTIGKKEKTPKPQLPPAIHTQVLPEDDSWDVFVTYVAPSGQIWLRIIGDQFSVSNLLMEQIGLAEIFLFNLPKYLMKCSMFLVCFE